MSDIQTSVEYILEKTNRQIPKVAMQLGSGLNDVADSLTDRISIPYGEIPGFPTTSVEGHAGCLHVGKLNDTPVLCLQGRVHYYEGHGFEPARHTIRTLKGLGIQILLLTNAAGSLSPHMPPGSLMSIRDHMNFSGTNPLIGPNDDTIGPRFVDLINAYDAELRELLRQSAMEINQHLYEGVYIMASGPSFETASEICAYRILGADAVGMSTVPECILARHVGLKVAAVSTITNFAAGMTGNSLSHAETQREGKAAAGRLSELLAALLSRLA